MLKDVSITVLWAICRAYGNERGARDMAGLCTMKMSEPPAGLRYSPKLLNVSKCAAWLLIEYLTVALFALRMMENLPGTSMNDEMCLITS